MPNPVKSGIPPVDKTHSTTISAASAKIEEDLESQKSSESGNTGIGSVEKEHLLKNGTSFIMTNKDWLKIKIIENLVTIALILGFRFAKLALNNFKSFTSIEKVEILKEVRNKLEKRKPTSLYFEKRRERKELRESQQMQNKEGVEKILI